MNRLAKYNQVLIAVLLTGCLLVAIGSVIKFGFYIITKRTQNRGVQVQKTEIKNEEQSETERIITISEPYFYDKKDNKFLIAEVEIQKSTDGSGFFLSTGKSWSGGTFLNFYSTSKFLTGCNSCWFRNLIFFENGESEGKKLYSNNVLITRFYIPDPESNLLQKKSRYSENKRKSLSNLVLYSAIEKDTNKDGLLNKLDEEITYITDLSFNMRTRITPPATKLLDWEFDLQGNNLFLYVKQDTNKNKKFDELDKRSVLFTNIQKPSLAQAVIGPMKK